jgi:hypothetical protein
VIPLALGALTVLAGRGVLVLLDSAMTIEALSLVVCTMMGLALGVDYSLFIVSRFREELARGAAPPAAARTARRTAGRTIAVAGAPAPRNSSTKLATAWLWHAKYSPPVTARAPSAPLTTRCSTPSAPPSPRTPAPTAARGTSFASST